MNINISKSIHINQDNELEEASVRSIVALASDSSKQTLLQSIALGQQRDFYFRVTPNVKASYTQPDYLTQKSEDGGATWQNLETLPITEKSQDGKYLLWDAPHFMAHPTCPNTVARLRAVCEDLPGVLPWDSISPRKYSGRIYVEISNDAGQTWKQSKQLICDGGDETSWSPLTHYGINSGRVVAGAQALYLAENTFALPFVAAHQDKSKLNPQQHTSSLLFGDWNADKTQIHWHMGGSVTLPEQGSVDGGDEPSVEKLKDGRLIMVLRARALKDAPKMSPSGKYFSISEDQGMTWLPPQQLCYEDGQMVYAPASMASVMRLGPQNKLYILMNILDKPTYNCDPRTILHLGQMDEEKLCLMRWSIQIVDQRDPANQAPQIRFSNWAWYKDPIRQSTQLYVTACPGDVGRNTDCRVPPYSYQYEIT